VCDIGDRGREPVLSAATARHTVKGFSLGLELNVERNDAMVKGAFCVGVICFFYCFLVFDADFDFLPLVFIAFHEPVRVFKFFGCRPNGVLVTVQVDDDFSCDVAHLVA
jgi:hypothetical protein